MYQQEFADQIEIQAFNSIYYFEFSKDFTHPMEKHNFWELVYVDNGCINAISSDATCKLHQGQIIFRKPMEMHAHVSDNHVANNMFVVCFTTESSVMDFFKNKTFTLDKTGKTLLSLFMQEAKNALGKIPDDYANKTPLRFSGDVFGATQLLKCYLIEFLIHLIRNGDTLDRNVVINKDSRNSASNSISELIVEYMKNNLYTQMTLNDLCEYFLMSKTQLCKIFKENIGESPMGYYNKLKIKEAKKLLREKNNSVTQISDMLHYSSVHNFSRAFKNIVGLSPVSYTKSIL